MTETFSLHRQEIIYEAPEIRDITERRPALFDATQINEEFKIITTISIESTLMAKLDHCNPKLMDVFSSRGRATRVSLRQIKDMLLEPSVYLGDKEEDLFKEFCDTEEELEAGLSSQVMNIPIISDASSI